MRLPPLFVRVRVAAPQRRLPTLWLPLFLLWPLLFALLLVLALPGIVVLSVLAPRSIGVVFALMAAVYALLCEMRGTLIDVAGGPSAVFIAIS